MKLPFTLLTLMLPLLATGLWSCTAKKRTQMPVIEEKTVDQPQNEQAAGTDENKNEAAESININLTAEERSELYYSILLANIADARQVYDVARDNYLKAAKITGHPSYAKSAVFAAERLRDYETSLLAAELWAVRSPDDLHASEITTIGHLRKGDAESALQHFMRLVRQLNHDNEQSVRSLLRIVRAVRTQTTLDMLQMAASNKPDAAYLWLLISQIAVYLEDKGLGYDTVNKALAIDPDFITAIKQKAHLLFRDKRVDEAEALLKQQLINAPNNRDVLIGLARLYYDLQEFHQAIQHLTTLTNTNTSDLEARYLLAICFHASRRWQESLIQFSHLIRFNYQRNFSLFYSGDIYEKLGDPDSALRMYREISMGEFYTRAGIRQADILAEHQSPEQGLMVLDKLLNKTQHVRDVFLSKIELIYQHYGLTQALDASDKLISQFPDDISYPVKKMWLYLKANEPDKAMSHMKQIVTDNPDSEVKKKLILTASAYFRQMDFIKRSIAVLSYGLSLFPDDIDILYSRALFSEVVGDYNALEQDLRKILSIDKDSADAMNALGYTLVDLNKNLDEAETLIMKAYEKMPTNVAVIDSVGWLYFRKGEYKKAIKYLRLASRLEKSGEIVAHLAEALWYSGNREEALNTLKQFLDINPDDKKTRQLLDRFEPQH